MNRARKLVLFEEDEHAAPAFKMDRNGNLEKWLNSALRGCGRDVQAARTDNAYKHFSIRGYPFL